MSSLFQRFRQRLVSKEDGRSENVEVPMPTNEPVAEERMEQEQLEEVNQEDREEVDQENRLEGQNGQEVNQEVMEEQPEEQQEERTEQPEERHVHVNQVDEEVASTIPEEPQPSRWRDDVYIQTRKNFRRTTKEAFALDQFMSELPPIVSTEMQHYRSVNTAIFIQNIFHNFALILQGFLSGFALFHTIMAFTFTDIPSLLKGYQHIAAPMHAAFYFCFVISAIDAMDRFETGGTWRETLSRWIGLQRGGLALLIAFVGTSATVCMTKFEQYLATNLNSDTTPQSNSIDIWHWLSALRAVCAILGWLLVSLQPTANFTRDNLLAMAPGLQTNAQIGISNLSSESNRLDNAQVFFSPSCGTLDLSQDFLSSIKVLAAHQART